MSFIDRTFVWWALGGLAVAFALGYAIGGTLDAALTGLLWGGAVRMLVVHHVTYSINSLCHFFGSRDYETDDESRNLRWLSLLSLGESWHNNHHAFPTSAFHGLRWHEVDVSGLIDPRNGEARTRVGRQTRRSRPAGRRRQWRRGGRVSTEALRRELAEALPDRPFTVELWDGTSLPATNGGGGPTFTAHSKRRSPTRCARPASSASAARTCRASSTSTTSTAALDLLATWSPPPLDRRHAGAARARGRPRRRASSSRRRCPRRSCGRRGAATASCATSARSRHHYDVSNDYFALFLDESMTYSCGDLLARRADARGGAGHQARAGLHEARAAARPARARRRLRLGQLRDPRRVEPRRPRHRHHALGEPGAAARASASRSKGSRTRSRSASPTTASSPTSRSTRSPASAWSSTSARARSTSTRISSRSMLKPGGRAAQPRHRAAAPRRPRGRAVLRALRLPGRRAAAPLADRARARARRPAGRARRGLPARLRDDARALGASASTSTSTRRGGSRATSACASSACTCVQRATASSAASRTCTRSLSQKP